MTDKDFINQILREGIKTHVDIIVKELVEDAQKRLNSEIPRIVAGMSLEVEKIIDMQYSRDVITIRIKNDLDRERVIK